MSATTTTTAKRPNPAAKRRARLAAESDAAQHGIDTPATAISSGDAQSYVPPMSAFTDYIGRAIAGRDYVDVFEYARAGHINVLIEGPTGSGKTSAVLAYAAKRQVPFYAVSSSVGLEPSQLFGKYVPNADTGGFEWVDGPVTTVVRNGGVLLLNEMNFIPERIATVLFSLLDRRREITLLDHKGEVVKAHSDLIVFGDLNPDYEGTRPLNKAFRNRFGIQLTWDYDESVERSLVRSDALRNLAGRIRQSVADGTFETPCSTNALIEFETARKGLGYEFAVYNFVQHYASHEREAVGLLFTTAESGLRESYKQIDRIDAGLPEPVEPEAPKVESEFDATWGVETGDLQWVFEAAAS
jgi:nitric oxide reductase NorQ protein